MKFMPLAVLLTLSIGCGSAQVNDRLGELQAQYEAKKEEARTFESKAQSLASESSRQIGDLNSTVASLTSRLNETDAVLTTTRHHLAKIRAQKAGAEKDLAAASAELEELRNRPVDAPVATQDISERETLLEKRVREFQERVRSLQDRSVDVQERLRQAQATIALLQGENIPIEQALGGGGIVSVILALIAYLVGARKRKVA